VKDIRLGDDLWEEWEGLGLEEDGIIYYTNDHTNIKNELVRKALASAMQKDGVAVSLGEAFKMLETSKTFWGWAGYLEGERELYLCDENEKTEHGDTVIDSTKITWIVF
jgi:hypothetical protein